MRKAASVEQVARGPHAPMMRQEMAAYRGGDLTRMAAVDEILARFGEKKPTSVFVTDEHGYRNEPPTDNQSYPVMVVGDSFLDVQYGETENFVKLLAETLEQPVYNHSYPGAGAFWGLHRYLIEGRFRERPPRVMVWGLLERELGGSLFAGYVYHLRVLEKGQANPVSAKAGIAWDQVKPELLTASLPDTSFVAAAARRFWNISRYKVFGAITPDVIISRPDLSGRDYLFYLYNLNAMAWTPEQRDPVRVARSVKFIRDYLHGLGTELVIMLIPEKEQVYRELIPGGDQRYPSSALNDVERELNTRNIPVVNLLPAFLDAKARGMPLYWRDDTHWRPEAMRIAAEMVGERVKRIGDRP